MRQVNLLTLTVLLSGEFALWLWPHIASPIALDALTAIYPDWPAQAQLVIISIAGLVRLVGLVAELIPRRSASA